MKRHRTAFTIDQINELEKQFRIEDLPKKEIKVGLADRLGLPLRVVEVCVHFGFQISLKYYKNQNFEKNDSQFFGYVALSFQHQRKSISCNKNKFEVLNKTNVVCSLCIQSLYYKYNQKKNPYFFFSTMSVILFDDLPTVSDEKCDIFFEIYFDFKLQPN